MVFESGYKYTFIYRLLHIILGGIIGSKFLSYNQKVLLFLLILIYQIGQYALNIRVFFFSNEIKNGNSIDHTANKFIDYLIGFFIVQILIKYIY